MRIASVAMDHIGKEGDNVMDSTAEIQYLFGLRVRELREARGWQLDDLGVQLGRSRASMSRIETGKQNLTMAHIAAIAAVFDVPVAVLFGGSSASLPPPTLEKLLLQIEMLHVKTQGIVADTATMVATAQAVIGTTQDASSASLKKSYFFEYDEAFQELALASV
jgi:transcriptional regulator with XRE-family HTH domain